MATQFLEQFMASLLRASQQNNIEFEQINKRKGKACLIKFILHLVSHLQMEQDILCCGLVIARRVVDRSIKFTKKNIHKLITVAVMLAEKVYEEEHHNLQSYSLLSGITIKEIEHIEQKILLLIDFHVLVNEEEIAKLKMNSAKQAFQLNKTDEEVQ